MQKLRTIHLYLGCLFALMLLFFTISGMWQTIALAPAYQSSKASAWLSTIHTSHPLKAGTLSSSLLRVFVLVIAASFVAAAILGIVMALRFVKSRRAALYCLATGAGIPLAIILIAALAKVTC